MLLSVQAQNVCVKTCELNLVNECFFLYIFVVAWFLAIDDFQKILRVSCAQTTLTKG